MLYLFTLQAKMQYLFTLQVNKYCILALQNSLADYTVTLRHGVTFCYRPPVDIMLAHHYACKLYQYLITSADSNYCLQLLF